MTDEEKREKYKEIVYRLKTINRKINNLEGDISFLKAIIKNNVLINGQGYQEENLNNIKDNIESSSDSINNHIISSLNNKIYN